MKNKLTLLALSVQKINRQHVQLVFVHRLPGLACPRHWRTAGRWWRLVDN